MIQAEVKNGGATVHFGESNIQEIVGEAALMVFAVKEALQAHLIENGVDESEALRLSHETLIKTVGGMRRE